MHLLATDAAKLRQASICVVKWSSVLKTSMVWRCVVRVGLVSRSFDTEHFRTVAGLRVENRHAGLSTGSNPNKKRMRRNILSVLLAQSHFDHWGIFMYFCDVSCRRSALTL